MSSPNLHTAVAWRFVTRSALGTHEVYAAPCMGHHVRWWPLVYAAAFCQPMSWGFLVRPRDAGRKPGAANERWLAEYTGRMERSVGKGGKEKEAHAVE